MTTQVMENFREVNALSTTEQSYSKPPEKMLPTFTKWNAEPSELCSPVERAFLEWMAVWKFTWDKKTGGKVILAASSIQHGEATILPSTIPIQPGKSSVSPTPDSPPVLSPRLAFRKQILISPPAPSPSFSSSSSTDSKSEPPLFSTEYFEVIRSPKGGYGAFALKDIEVDTIVISEKPLFKATTLTVYYEYEKLSREQRREYNTLYGWKGVDSEPTMARFQTNRFEINPSTGGIFLNSSRFNHACREYKTCSYSYDGPEDRLIVTAFRTIKKGEEITISYSKYPTNLHENYGFRCDCPGCPDPKIAEENEKIMRGTSY